MLCARAASTAVRRRGLALISPPPMRAATVISLMSFVKIFPRLASLAAFLVLIVPHLEWPDIERLRTRLPSLREYHMAPTGTTLYGAFAVHLPDSLWIAMGGVQCGEAGWRCWGWEHCSSQGARPPGARGSAPRHRSRRSRKASRPGTARASTAAGRRAARPTTSTI